MNLEKLAEMTPEERAAVIKYLKAGLGAGVLASGIGLTASRLKSLKERAKHSPENSRNAIIVDINKNNFLKDLPTPEAQAQMVAGAAPAAIVGGQEAKQQMTEEEIAAAKKDILRRGRKMDFFGLRKAAAPKSEVRQILEQAVGKDGEKKDGGEKKPEPPKLPRDAEGRFVSPTSPIAAFQSEKDAFDLSPWFMNPIDSAKEVGGRAWESAKTHPFGLAAGGLSAIYLSALIVDKVNEMRAKASKRSANVARQEYIRMLQHGDEEGAEKTAEDGKSKIPEYTGAIAGASVVLPYIVSAMITNRILENRKEKDKKAKTMANSYPEDPVILYKTSEAKEIKLNPDAAFVMIMLKQAMFEAVGGFEKSAAGLDKLKAMYPGAAKAIGGVVDKATDGMYDVATDSIIGALGNKDNSGDVLNMARAYQAYHNQKGSLEDVYESMKPIAYKTPIASSFATLNKNEMMKRIASDKRTYDILAGYVSSDDAGWKKFREQAADNWLAKQKIFRPESPIYKAILWMVNNLGIGKHFARKTIHDKLMAMSGKNKVQKPQT